MIKQGRHKEKFPDVLSRKTAIFIHTAMVTSNLTQYVMGFRQSSIQYYLTFLVPHQ